MQTTSWNERLPGGRLIERGIADFLALRHTIASCLVHIARGRLTRAGLLEKSDVANLPDAELELYRLLLLEGGDAYSRYNSLIRELVSFENALDHLNLYLTADRGLPTAIYPPCRAIPPKRRSYGLEAEIRIPQLETLLL